MQEEVCLRSVKACRGPLIEHSHGNFMGSISLPCYRLPPSTVCWNSPVIDRRWMNREGTDIPHQGDNESHIAAYEDL
jgi:hypothetical protein